jgi:5,10-methylenetetrahydromethanopterin reductase
MPGVEVWTSGAGLPRAFVHRAQEAERAGFDGISIVDSQNLSGDCYIALAIAAHETEHIRLATGVTNPFTRHPAVAACAIATVQAESHGRAVLGIGRGDSALAHLGYAPASVSTLEHYLRRLQGYLSGESVPFEPDGNLASLGLATVPESSRIEWIRPGRYPKVPVDVAATGPKVIRVGARLADRVTFAVGADPERIRWAIRTAEEARTAAGLGPDSGLFGAYVNVVVNDDPEAARQLGEGGLSLFGRFQAMYGHTVGPATDEQRRTTEAIHDAYDMTRHSRAASPQTRLLTPDFAAQFGVFGSPGYCLGRLREIVALGLSQLVIVGPTREVDPAAASTAEARFVEEVLPGLHEMQFAR